MAILPKAGRTAFAKALKERPLHFAWGTGNPAWDTTPEAEDNLATGLVNEIGRRAVLSVAFVVPDPDGLIDIEGAGTFTETTEPTNQIVAHTKFDFADGVGSTVRELALFMDTEIVSGLPPGQMYFTPSQIAHPGLIVQLEHVPAMIRSQSTREQFYTLITL